jgi:SAM-dependent methyltransferase
MHEISASHEEILAGYDALADIYSHVPPLIMWRAWEYALYRKFTLSEPVLDVGCGDGRFFRRVFPDVRHVVGIDHSDIAVDLAKQSGIYREVYQTPAHQLPFATGSMSSVFANCAVEHMDHIDEVLSEIHRVVRPGGGFLMSVVTDTFVSWAPLEGLLTVCDARVSGRAAQLRHQAYHHLVNFFPRDEWIARCERAGFRARQWAPMVAGSAGWVFLLLDQLWHMETAGGEFGDRFAATLQAIPKHAHGLRRMFEGLLEMSEGAQEYAGLVLWLEK